MEKTTSLSEAFLSQMITELDNETVRAMILRGSYVRTDTFPPYSDVDITLMIQETAGYHLPQRFFWRDGYLVSVSAHSYAAYRERLARPERAIFAVMGLREAHVLLDKDGSFQVLQQEARHWTWEPLQALADAYVSQLMVEQTEIVLKTLRALALHDGIALSEMTLDLFSAVTEAIAVQRGVLVRSGNTYFHQVQAATGPQSVWTHYHLQAAGITPQPPLSVEERGRETLYLYRETARLLRPSLSPEHLETIGHTIQTLEFALSQKEIG